MEWKVAKIPIWTVVYKTSIFRVV